MRLGIIIVASFLFLVLATNLFMLYRLESLGERLGALERQAMNSGPRSPVVRPGGDPPDLPAVTLGPRGLESLAQQIASSVVLQTHGAARESDVTRSAPMGPSPEQQEAVSEGNRMLAAVLSSGKLRVEDVHELARLRASSGGAPEFQEIRAKLSAAINRGQLIPENLAAGLP